MNPFDADARRIADRYRLDERVGVGAMGAVWRATDELLNRTVAIKELLVATSPPAESGTDAAEESRQRILREGRIGARLQHAHVISLFDVVVHAERPFLIMEYLPSRSLASVLAERGAIGAREAAALGRQIADGLAAAHAAGVVHRDIKPGNVLISEHGHCKITDFGVSRVVDDVQLTRTGVIAGTPAFLAPEVARGGQPTLASDVFALGATLYAAVESEPPFGLDDNTYAMLHRVATGTVRTPTAAGPLTALLLQLLTEDPTQRPSASQARDALAAIAAGAPTPPVAAAAAVLPGTGPVSPAPTLAEVEVSAAALRQLPLTLRTSTVAPTAPPRRHRRLPALLALLAVLVVVGAGVVIGTMDAPAHTEQAARATPVPTPAAPAPRTPSSAAPTSTGPTTSRSAPPAQTDAVAFVHRYYALLPENLEEAFVLLGPAAQVQSGGIDGFRQRYAELSAVAVESAQASGANIVQATIALVRSDGTTSREPLLLVIGTGSDGQMIVQSMSRL